MSLKMDAAVSYFASAAQIEVEFFFQFFFNDLVSSFQVQPWKWLFSSLKIRGSLQNGLRPTSRIGAPRGTAE